MPEIKGFDASHHNDIDFKAAKAAGYSFVFLKATEGNTFVDPNFEQYYKEARAAGLDVGAYHFARFSDAADVKAEYDHFKSVISGKKFTYPLVLDLETAEGLDKKTLTDRAVQFLELLEADNYFAMIYTGKAFMEDHLDETRLLNYAKWIARYAKALGRTADVWQYTSTGSINGVPDKTLDLDISYVDFASIIAKAKKNIPPIVQVDQKKPTPAPKKPAPKPVPKPTSGSIYSIVDYLKAHHMPYDFASRLKLAKQLGIKNYNGTAAQNLQMIDLFEKNKKTLHEYYVVRSGDTLSEIAASHHTTVAKLLKLNPNIKDKNKIVIGQKIILK